MGKKNKQVTVETEETIDFGNFVCWSCEHDKCSLLNLLPSTEIDGIDQNGKKYTRIDRYRVGCDQCGVPQVYFIKR